MSGGQIEEEPTNLPPSPPKVPTTSECQKRQRDPSQAVTFKGHMRTQLIAQTGNGREGKPSMCGLCGGEKKDEKNAVARGLIFPSRTGLYLF